MNKINEGPKTAGNMFLKPALNIASPYYGMAVSARTKNPQFVTTTSDIVKSISGGKILSLTDIHGRGLRLKVM